MWRDCAKTVGLRNQLSRAVAGFAPTGLCSRKAVSRQRRLRRTETQFECRISGQRSQAVRALGPFGWQVDETGNTHAVWEATKIVNCRTRPVGRARIRLRHRSADAAAADEPGICWLVKRRQLSRNARGFSSRQGGRKLWGIDAHGNAAHGEHRGMSMPEDVERRRGNLTLSAAPARGLG